MPSSEARRQKKLQKKKNKRQQKVASLQRRDSHDPSVVLQGVESWPIYDVRVPSTLWEVGMGNVIIARRSPDRRLVVGIFLLDIFYFGIKNAFWRTFSPQEYTALIMKMAKDHDMDLYREPPEYLAKLLHDMEAWALNETRCSPHVDYRHARKLLAGIDPNLCQETFTFGKDGKPMLISGPYDGDIYPMGNETESGVLLLDDELDEDDEYRIEVSRFPMR